MTTSLNFLALTLLANRMSRSANESPPVSGRRKYDHVVHSRFVPRWKKADFAPQFLAWIRTCTTAGQAAATTAVSYVQYSPSIRGYEAGVELVSNDAVDAEHGAAKYDGPSPESSRRDFADNCVACVQQSVSSARTPNSVERRLTNRPDREMLEQVDHHRQSTDCPCSRGPSVDAPQDPDGE
jgi:hypothetical protein